MSLQITKVKGIIPIKLHFTLIIVFFLIAWTLASGFMPQYFPNLSTVHYWIMGISGAAILFISVLLHELAHSILSLKYGLAVRQIILFIFGGVSDIKEEERTKEDYSKEFKIAVVGPLTSFVLAGIFAFAWRSCSSYNSFNGSRKRGDWRGRSGRKSGNWIHIQKRYLWNFII